MRVKTTIAASVLGLAMVLGACSGQNPDDSRADSGNSSGMSQQASSAPASPGDPSSAGDAATSLTGHFHGLNGKSVKGTVTVADGKVTLSGFSSDEGPDLHLYLARGTDEAAVAAGTELGAVAFGEASQSFSLSGGADFTEVLVHCDKAKAVFGAAELAS